MTTATTLEDTITNYQGTYKITAVFENSASVPIPTNYNNDDNMFRITIDRIELNIYNFHMKIGNSMGTTMTVLLGKSTTKATMNDVQFGPIRSTKMMPSPDVYQVEVAMKHMLDNQVAAIRFMEDDRNNNCGNDTTINNNSSILMIESNNNSKIECVRI